LLVENEERNTLVCDDILDALGHGRRCLVLSQWKEHCNLLASRLRSLGVSPIVLEGGLGKRARTALLGEIARTPLSEPLVVVATGQYLGEGFDCPQLDALFLAFPVSFKGRLVQYTGRLLRADDHKTSVCVYDYADIRVPVLRAMHARRLTTYKQLRFSENVQAANSPQLTVPILAA
jgi:superfamily II DNA or RNA helicase